MSSFQEFSDKAKAGYSVYIDMSSLFDQIKLDFIVNKDFLRSIKNIELSGYPDSDPIPYGWNMDIKIVFY